MFQVKESLGDGEKGRRKGVKKADNNEQKAFSYRFSPENLTKIYLFFPKMQLEKEGNEKTINRILALFSTSFLSQSDLL